jgi:hypothetical protein
VTKKLEEMLRVPLMQQAPLQTAMRLSRYRTIMTVNGYPNGTLDRGKVLNYSNFN